MRDAFKRAFGEAAGYCAPVALILALAAGYFEVRIRPGLGPAGPAAGVDVGELARAYAPEILDTFGDAYIAAGAKVEAPGTKMLDVLKVKQETWDALRIPRFNRLVAPAFDAVLPEGAEPTDAQRPMVGKLYRDFGQAMKKASGK